MTEAKDNAHRQGEVLVLEARQRVQQVLAEGAARLQDLRREALAVHREKETFLERFRSLAEAQIRFVESHHADFAEFDNRLLHNSEASPLTAGPAQAAAVSAAGSLEPDRWRDYQPRPLATPHKATEPASPEVTVAAVRDVPATVPGDGGPHLIAEDDAATKMPEPAPEPEAWG